MIVIVSIAISLAAIAGNQDLDDNLVFPQERLDKWVKFSERVPQKFVMHRDCSSSGGGKGSFFVSEHGLLTVSTIRGTRTELIQNAQYNATVRVNPDGSYTLVNIGESLADLRAKNMFHNASMLGIDLFAPDLIAAGHLKLVEIKTIGKNTRYEFISNGGEIPKGLVGVAYEFCSEFDLPINVEHKISDGKREVFSRTEYSDFELVADEWLPTTLGGGNGDKNEYTSKNLCKLSYDPKVEFGPERFRLSFYGIEEPLIKGRAQWSNWIWGVVAVGLCLLVFGFRCVRKKD